MTEEQRKMVEDHIGLVGKTISEYYKQHLGDEDIYQIGCIGLIRAAINYNKLDIAFTTYAVYTIRNTLYRHFKEVGALKRKSNLNTKSIYERMPGTEDIELYETLADHVDFTDQILIDLSLQSVLKRLNEREQKIFIGYLQGYTFREMSSQMNVTRQRICQIFNTKLKPLIKEVLL